MKKKKTQKRYIRGIKKLQSEEITNEHHLYMKDYYRLSKKRISLNVGSLRRLSHATLLLLKNVKTYERIHENHTSISCHVFCLNLCVLYMYVSQSVSSPSLSLSCDRNLCMRYVLYEIHIRIYMVSESSYKSMYLISEPQLLTNWRLGSTYYVL